MVKETPRQLAEQTMSNAAKLQEHKFGSKTLWASVTPDGQVSVQGFGTNKIYLSSDDMEKMCKWYLGIEEQTNENN